MKAKRKILILLLLVQLAVLLFFGTQKKGMHFDELFSYFNTNNSAGRQAYDRSWVTSEKIRQELQRLAIRERNWESAFLSWKNP